MANETTPKSAGPKWGLIVGVAALLGVGAWGIYATLGPKGNEVAQQKHGTSDVSAVNAAKEGFTRALSKGDMAAFLVHKAPKDIPDFAFKDGNGKDLKLSDWKGRVVLVNLWATWCAPCRREMPHLAELQEKLGGDGFEVVAISVDRKGVAASAQFLKKAKAEKLALYIDKSTKVLAQSRTIGLPVTILVNRQGKEIGRLTGPATWNGADAIRLVKTAIAIK